MVATTEVLWDVFHQRLRSYVARRIENTADVDDIVQDIFVRIHERIGSVENEERVHAWIYQIARNAAIDSHRRNSHAVEVSMDADDGLRAALLDLAQGLAEVADAWREIARQKHAARVGKSLGDLFGDALGSIVSRHGADRGDR